jgi:hemin uptake protein HemP
VQTTPAKSNLIEVVQSTADTTPISPSNMRWTTSQALLAGAQELIIDHNGVIYRLRQTALDKLILTK